MCVVDHDYLFELINDCRDDNTNRQCWVWLIKEDFIKKNDEKIMWKNIENCFFRFNQNVIFTIHTEVFLNVLVNRSGF